nr:MAG TPA: hypothetical protein [Caudoviricetes sp.]
MIYAKIICSRKNKSFNKRFTYKNSNNILVE